MAPAVPTSCAALRVPPQPEEFAAKQRGQEGKITVTTAPQPRGILSIHREHGGLREPLKPGAGAAFSSPLPPVDNDVKLLHPRVQAKAVWQQAQP